MFKKSVISTIVSFALAYTIVHAEVMRESVNSEVAKSFNSILKMFDGSQIGTRYIYTETNGVETGNKAQWRARLNFTYVLKNNEAGKPEWVLRAGAFTGGKYDSGWNDLAGSAKSDTIDTPNSDFNMRHLWIEYNWDKGTAQFGSLETTAKGFAQGVATLESSGWIKGARFIGNKLNVLGYQVDRVAVTAGRADEFEKPMFNDGWGEPNYYDITVEVTPIDDLKLALSNSVFTGIKQGAEIDYSPRVYAEYNTAKLFKNIIDSVSAEVRFHTAGEHTLQRFAVAANKKFQTGFAKDWSTQIAYVDSTTDELYAPMNALYTPNKYGTYQGKQVSFTIETAPLAKPFDGQTELKAYGRARFGIGGNDEAEQLAADNSRIEFGVTLTEKYQDPKNHIFRNIEEEQKRIAEKNKQTFPDNADYSHIQSGEDVHSESAFDRSQHAGAHVGN